MPQLMQANLKRTTKDDGLHFKLTAYGTKLKKFILIQIKTPLKNLIQPSNLVLVYDSNGCFNEIIFSEQFINNLIGFWER